MTKNIITKVSDYLNKLKEIDVKGDSQQFYRGVSKEKYAVPEDNVPSIYRKTGWIKNEDRMFYELISRLPDEFRGCQNTFEYLVKMQHYGYPTRLLDITSNPLVALYFACAKDDGDDGSLITFNIKRNDIRNYESDTVALISNLTLINRKSSHNIFIFNQFRNLLVGVLEYVSGLDTRYPDTFLGLFILKFSELRPQIDLFIAMLRKLYDSGEKHELLLVHVNSAFLAFIKLIQSFVIYCESTPPVLIENFKILQKSVNSEFDQFKSVLEGSGLDHIDDDLKGILDQKDIKSYVIYIEDRLRYLIDNLNMKKYSKYFYDYDKLLLKNNYGWDSNKIISKDLTDVVCVIPKYDNSRIVAQQGAFLLFGFSDTGESILDKPNIEKTIYNDNLSYFRIPAQYKNNLLAELHTLGVSSSVLFPEIESVTKEIKDRYAQD